MHIRLRTLLFPLLLLVVVVSAAPPLVPPVEAAACHGWITCPDPKSCNQGWSTLINCDGPFCDTHPDCDRFGDGSAIVQLKEKFRTCFLADGSQCQEWQIYSFKVHCNC